MCQLTGRMGTFRQCFGRRMVTFRQWFGGRMVTFQQCFEGRMVTFRQWFGARMVTFQQYFGVRMVTFPQQTFYSSGSMLADNESEESPMRISRYEINLTVTPATGHIQSKARCLCVAAADTDRVQFLLHRDLSISRIEGKGISGFSVEPDCAFPFTPEASTITVNLDHTARVGETLDMIVDYSGTQVRVPEAWGVNCVTPEWVELGMYGPWFPWQPSDQEGFTYSVRVAAPPGYSVTGLGESERAVNGWLVRSSLPVTDIVVIAAPDLGHKTVERGGVRATTHFPSPAGEQVANLAGTIADDVVWILEYFRSWLRDDSDRVSSASVVISPRTSGGGYARPGFVVLGDIEALVSRPQATFKYAAHEFSHFWWCSAPKDIWEDWLNEGFAEYSALRATRAKFGEEGIRDIVRKKGERAAGLPPVRGIDRTSGQAYQVLYDKACLLLMGLAARIGEQAFDKVAREFLSLESKHTAAFLEVLAKHAGRDVSADFDRLLSE